MEGSSGELRPIPRDPFRFDLVRLFEAHLATQGGALGKTESRGDFVASIGEPLTKAIRDPNLLRGLRVEAMFEAMVASLGQAMLIKHEDSGTVWTSRRGLKIPDFRVVLKDGRMFLAEVKHFRQGGTPTKPFSMSASYYDGLRAYEDAVGCSVELAIYWARWNTWTLVPLSALRNKNRLHLSLERAIKLNEMGRLGDFFVGTQFPLRFSLIADERRPRKVKLGGKVEFTISGVEIYCREQRLTAKREQSIAMWFMLYGPWDEEATAHVKDGELQRVDFTRSPPQDSGQGFEMVGALSSLFSSMYLSSTSEDGAVTRLGIAVKGGSLESLIPREYKSTALPLLRFRTMPPQGNPAQ